MVEIKRTSVTSDVTDLLMASYKEVLDAVKHQDDKIGRLFTGIAFLTAAALAMANLGSARYLSQKYTGWEAPPAMLSLAAYLLLVVVAVTLLISSFATPLRVPGLSRGANSATVDWVGPRPSSQIYFGEISKLSIREWELKWKSDKKRLEKEFAQSLVGETHNLAVRTQFKYGRMSEAIAVFNLALLALALTMIMCVASASIGAPTGAVEVPGAAVWAMSAAVAVFFYLQLLSQVRYTRQTVDELDGRKNFVGGALRYGWVTFASVWILLVGSGEFVDGKGAAIVWICAIAASVLLLAGTILQRKSKGIEKLKSPRQYLGTGVALLTGLVLGALSTASEAGGSFPRSLLLVLGAACIFTLLAALSPTLNLHRNLKRYQDAKPG